MVDLVDGIEMSVPPRVQRRIDRDSSHIEHYPTEDLIPEIPSGIGPKVWIPRNNIFGTQSPKEYSERKKLLAIKAFEEDPKGFLDKEPIIVCLVPSGQDESRLIIIDGHHRLRESGRLRIKVGRGEKYLYNKVPCRVFTPEEMVELLNKSGHRFEGKDGARQPYTAALLIEKLNIDADQALEEFQSTMPDSKTPKPLNGIVSVQQIQSDFSQPPSHFTTQI